MLLLDKVQKDKISPWTLKRCLKWNLKSEGWTYHSDSIASPCRILSRWNPEPSPASNARFMGEGSSFWISPPDATKRWMASLIWCRSGVGSTDNFCFISPKIIVQFLLDVNHEMLIPTCVHQHGKNKKSIHSFRPPVLPPFLNGWIVQHEPHALGKKIRFDPGIGFFLSQEMQTKHFQNNPENFLGRLRKKL